MNTAETYAERLASRVGTAVIISWFLYLGPLGFVLMLGVAYAMFLQNLALGLICGLLLLAPSMLAVAWLVAGVWALKGEASRTELSPARESLAEAARGS